ncbi:MAG: 4-hydroxy-3-methylbut-2-enyl diphosphate reductase [Methylacidiphilales bacterium]|nr:4-hydroxy-3-methylbut-2-enyl diphosphate reductase [Candidatus Methylacidiphilales bacterium]
MSDASQPNGAAPAPKKRINLRTPEIMKLVQEQVESHYRSPVVEYLRHTKSYLSANGLTVKLAKAFGFCYGVERAINLAYASAKYFKGHNIYLLGEIIHNPEVNDQLREMGIKQLKETRGVYDLDGLTEEDVVIVPAFGAEVKVLHRLKDIGCYQVDTTCGDVMSVWRRVHQYRKQGTTSIIHGKAWHEETKATVSQAISENGSTHYLVVFSLAETDYVCDYIRKGGNKDEFLKKFEGAYSPGFDPDQHLVRVGIANQTTMMKNETEEVQHRFEKAMADRFGRGNLDAHFSKADTICGATQERQDALSEMLGQEKMNLLLVVGGYNSSNTSHLAEMGEAVLPTYFIKNSEKLISPKEISHYDQHRQQEIITHDWLPEGKAVVGITAGASCPNNLLEETIHRLYEFRDVEVESLLPADYREIVGLAPMPGDSAGHN